MNVDEALNAVMGRHEKTVKSKKKKTASKPKKKRIMKPTEPLDPENEKIRPTLIKVCAYLEWMMQELHEMREELEAKPELSDHNSLSLRVDQLDGSISNLADRIDDLE
jgi:hypothetical protein